MTLHEPLPLLFQLFSLTRSSFPLWGVPRPWSSRSGHRPPRPPHSPLLPALSARSSRRCQPPPPGAVSRLRARSHPGLSASLAQAPEGTAGAALGAEPWRRGACSQPGRAAEQRRERRAPWKRAEAGKERQEEDAELRAALAARARVPGWGAAGRGGAASWGFSPPGVLQPAMGRARRGRGGCGPARPSRGLLRLGRAEGNRSGSVCALAGQRAAPGGDRAGLSDAEVGGQQCPPGAQRWGLGQQPAGAELPSPPLSPLAMWVVASGAQPFCDRLHPLPTCFAHGSMWASLFYARFPTYR